MLDFFKESLLGADNKISSKKLTAFWLVVLITIIVISILIITYLAIFRQVTISDITIRLLSISVEILLYLLISTLLIYGVQGVQQITSLKILNPPPPSIPAKVETTVNQPENMNINNPSNTQK